MSNTVTLLYFASLREAIGKSNEDFALPNDIMTASDLLNYLSLKSETYKAAFEDRQTIRIAIDQQHCEHDADITAAREIAFFPPMTGG